MKLEPGQMIRDYQIIRSLGEGGMGEVYLANEVLLERQVAIKRLNPIYTRDPQFIQRFRNEARIQAQLTHENIVQLITFFSEADTHYMVLEYAPGHTLRDLIQQTGPIPEQRALGILRQITAALSHANSKGIIHRDIKPSNIMIDTEHGDRVKIMDFGIARLMTDGHLTRTGTKMGTIMYMSPEQVLALKDIDHRSDVYSLGVVFYEMLCGKTAYQVDTDSDFLVQRAIVDTPIPDPREIYAHISDESVKVLTGMTSKDREERIGLEEVYNLITGYEGANNIRPVFQIKHPKSQTKDNKAIEYDDLFWQIQKAKEQKKHTKKLPLILLATTLIEHLILWFGYDEWEYIDGFLPAYIVLVCLSVLQYIATIRQIKNLPSKGALMLSVGTFIVVLLVAGGLCTSLSSEAQSLKPSIVFLFAQIVMASLVYFLYTINFSQYIFDDPFNSYRKLRSISYFVILFSPILAAILLLIPDV